MRDLILPDPPDKNGNVRVLSILDGSISIRPRRNTDVDWDHLSGRDVPVGAIGKQPYSGCRTGGDKVMARLMTFLAED